MPGFYQNDNDRLRPRPPDNRVYVDRSGNAEKGFRPSRSRALVPVGKPTGTALQTIPRPGTALQTTSPAPSSSSAPKGAQPFSENERFRERARTQYRAKADTADYQQKRAAQGKRYAEAAKAKGKGKGFLPKGLKGAGKLGLAGTAYGLYNEGVDVARVAGDEDSSALDVANQAASGAGRLASAGLGAAYGATFGPIGALVSGTAGYFGADALIDWGRDLLGADESDPAQRIAAREEPSKPVAVPPAMDAPAPEPVPATAPQVVNSPPVLDNNITREGNSFSARGPIREGFTVNGEPPALPATLMPERELARRIDPLIASNPPPASQALPRLERQARPVGFNPRLPPLLRDQAEEARRDFLRAASTPYQGSQNRQLTARQIEALQDFSANHDPHITDRVNTRAREQGATRRTGLLERGRNARFGAENAVNQARALSDLATARANITSQGFKNRQARRLETLYQQYENAKLPSEKSAIAEQIRILNGEDKPNRYQVVAGEQRIDPATGQLVSTPTMAFDQQTGQFVTPRGGAAQPPPVGVPLEDAQGKHAYWNGSRYVEF